MGGYIFSGTNGNNSPRLNEYTFYLAATDTSGNYSEYTEVTVQHPGIQQLVLESQDIQGLIATVKIKIPKVFSQVSQTVYPSDANSEEKDIIGYRLHIQEIDYDTLAPIGEEEIINIGADELKNRTYYYQAETGKKFEIRVGAYDSVYHPEYNPTLYEQTISAAVIGETMKIQEPDIPDDLITPSKLTNSLSETISLNETRSTQNGAWIDTNGADITTTVNEVFPDGTTSTSQIQQLSNEYSVKIQSTSNGTSVVSGFGLNLEGETSEFAVLADRFRIFGDTTGGTTVSSPIFAIDDTSGIVYIDSDQITLKSGTNNFFDLDSSGLSINTANLQIDKAGNAIFSGELQAATGTFDSVFAESNLTIRDTGYINSDGKTSFTSISSGFYMDYDTSTSKGRINIGDGTSYFKFDGDNFTINTTNFSIDDAGNTRVEGKVIAGDGLILPVRESTVS